MRTIQRTCQNCGKTYESEIRANLKYCTIRCAGAARRQREERTCFCGKAFYVRPSEADRQYCSRSCFMTDRNTNSFNPAHHRDISGERNPMYGRGMFGEANPMYGKRGAAAPQWRGGKKVRKDGYTLIVAPNDHPYPAYMNASGTKYILEHRRVVEKRIGRYLRPTEVVHHIDHDPSNNADDNLELFASQSEHIRERHGYRSLVT